MDLKNRFIDTCNYLLEQSDIEKWVTTADSDHGEGTSTASLEMSSAGHGLFHGNLQTAMPRDGRIKKAGYCNIRSLRSRVRLVTKIQRSEIINIIIILEIF